MPRERRELLLPQSKAGALRPRSKAPSAHLHAVVTQTAFEESGGTGKAPGEGVGTSRLGDLRKECSLGYFPKS